MKKIKIKREKRKKRGYKGEEGNGGLQKQKKTRIAGKKAGRVMREGRRVFQSSG